MEMNEVEVNGQYSYDLDLFYNGEDAADLFNIQSGSYIKICDQALQMIEVKDSN